MTNEEILDKLWEKHNHLKAYNRTGYIQLFDDFLRMLGEASAQGYARGQQEALDGRAEEMAEAYESGRREALEEVKALGVTRKMKIAETDFALKELQKNQPELSMQDLVEHNAEASGYDAGYAEAMKKTIAPLDSLTK